MKSLSIRVLGMFFIFLGGCATVPEAEHLEVKKALDTCQDNAAFYESVFNCIAFMHVGDYEQAEPYCKIAGAIHPNDEKYRLIMKMYEQEKASFEEAVMR